MDLTGVSKHEYIHVYKNMRRNNDHINTYFQSTRDRCCFSIATMGTLDRLAALLSQEAQNSSADKSSESKEKKSSICFHDLAAPGDLVEVVP